MWKHCLVEHDGREAEFEMKVLRTFKSCLDRQVNEAVRINISKADIVMNSKSEFRQAPVKRVVPAWPGEEAGGRPGGEAGGRPWAGVPEAGLGTGWRQDDLCDVGC